jgi:hypothetical protein
MAFAHRSSEEHIGDFAGQLQLSEINPRLLEALSGYVEVMSFKLIHCLRV